MSFKMRKIDNPIEFFQKVIANGAQNDLVSKKISFIITLTGLKN